MIINFILIINRILILTLSFLTANMAFAADCTEIALDVSNGRTDGGYSYLVPVTTGIPADNSNSPRQSTLRLFENGLEIGPAHSLHADIRNVGQGMFSHWSLPDGTAESIRFSSSDDTYPGTNEKSYSYCLTSTSSISNTTSPPSPTSGYHAPAPTSSFIVSVKNTGATGNGSTDDTAAIQAAVNQVGGTGGTVLVPNGTYMIDALTSVKLKSNMTFKMEAGAVLEAIPNAAGAYSIVKLSGVSNVNVAGGTIWGERHQHLGPGDMTMDGTGGQWGYCLSVWGGSNNYIEGVTSRECWGDGFYLDALAKNVFFYSVTAINNRRQGMSIIHADTVVVRDSIFRDTIGTPPQHGIDIEPDDNGNSVNNVQILNSKFINNNFRGIETYALGGPVTNVTISGNTFTDNQNGIEIVGASGHTISNNIITGKYGMAFYDATGNTVTGNTIKYTGGCITGGSGNTLSNNTCTLQ